MFLFTRNTLKRVVCVLRNNLCWYSEMPDKSRPVKFTTSEAAGWRAEFSRKGDSYDDSPDAQPYIVSLSTAIFLYYFLFYREESDVDEKFNIGEGFLYEKVDGLEEVQLKLARQAKLARGESVVEIEKRLIVLEAARLEKTLEIKTN